MRVRLEPGETYRFFSGVRALDVRGENQPEVTHTATYYGADGKPTRTEVITMPYTTDAHEGETHVSFGVSVDA